MPDYNSPIPLLDPTVNGLSYSAYSGDSLGEMVDTMIDAGGDGSAPQGSLTPDWDSPIPLLDPTVNDLWYNPYTGPPLLTVSTSVPPLPPIPPTFGFGLGPFGEGPFGG